MPQHVYSLARAIKAASERNPSGLELEVHQELSKGRQSSGFCVPLAAIAGKALTATTATAGGFTIGDEIVDIAEALRPASIALQSGALMVTLRSNATVPRISTGSSAFWLSETEECPESGVSLGTLNLAPHRCATWLKVSNQLLTQAPLADPLLKRDLRQAVGNALDLAIFSGVGGVEPLGLVNNETIQSYTFGAVASRHALAVIEKRLGDENANDGNAIWVTSPAVRQKWREIANDSVGGSGFLWSDQNTVLGRSAFATNNVTGNAVIFGDFSDLVIVNWGVIEISDPFSSKKSAQTELLFQVMADAGPMRQKSFVASTDSGAQ